MQAIAHILLLTLTQMLYLSALIITLLLLFKWAETKWAYKPLKPHKWQQAVQRGNVSPGLLRSERAYPDKVQFYTLWLQIERMEQQQVPGAFAEVGVYKGSSARVIHQMAPGRKLYLFDTFRGFPEEDLMLEPEKDKRYTTQCFSDVTMEEVKKNINGNENVLFYPGRFPLSAQSLPEEEFAFVHLDADLYKPTLEGLYFFYERLACGGVIIVHDFNHNWSGVTKAIKEFSGEIHEAIVEIPDSYGSAMIIKEEIHRVNSISA